MTLREQFKKENPKWENWKEYVDFLESQLQAKDELIKAQEELINYLPACTDSSWISVLRQKIEQLKTKSV